MDADVVVVVHVGSVLASTKRGKGRVISTAHPRVSQPRTWKMMSSTARDAILDAKGQRTTSSECIDIYLCIDTSADTFGVTKSNYL